MRAASSRHEVVAEDEPDEVGISQEQRRQRDDHQPARLTM